MSRMRTTTPQNASLVTVFGPRCIAWWKCPLAERVVRDHVADMNVRPVGFAECSFVGYHRNYTYKVMTTNSAQGTVIS